MRYVSTVQSPVGTVQIVADESAVVAVAIHPERSLKLQRLGLTGQEQSNQTSQLAAKQVAEYFAGKRTKFDLPVSFAATSQFSEKVLSGLMDVPYGEIRSYGALAEICGHPQAARAVGRVMAANPVPIIVPCHRIVGSSGKMTGYSGGDGIKTKEWLLAFEERNGPS